MAKLKDVRVSDLEIGNILRQIRDGADPELFSDCLVTYVDTERQIVKLRRPYAFAHTIGLCEGAMMEMERFESTFATIESGLYRIVCSDRGKPQKMEL